MDSVLWIAPAIVLLASCTRGLFGFGDSLVAVPLLMLVVEPTTAVATVALVSLIQGALMLARERRDIDWGASRRLVFAAALGVPFGLFSLEALPVEWVKRGLGLVLVVYATRSLLGAKLPEVRSPRAASVAGFASGALGAAYNFSGPPVILYSAMARWDAARTRATLQSFFTPLGVIVVSAHLLAGSITPDVLALSARCLPAMLVGVFAGAALSRRVDATLFRKVLDGALIALGAVLWL
jgi:hypothetical protein